jgi:DEAD/DEAH box helicase domain-containing protein
VDVQEAIKILCKQKEVVFSTTLSGQGARYAKRLPGEVPQTLGSITLYEHQAKAWEYASNGNSVLLATPTASGKTIAATLGYLELLKNEPDACLLCLAPTKALVEQWASRLTEMCLGLIIRTQTSDTPLGETRRKIKDHVQVLVATPDQVHMSLNSWHWQWSRF